MDRQDSICYWPKPIKQEFPNSLVKPASHYVQSQWDFKTLSDEREWSGKYAHNTSLWNNSQAEGATVWENGIKYHYALWEI